MGIAQSYHYGRRDQQWQRMGWDLAQQGMRVELLSTVREEIRDQVTICVSSLDNLMLVSTLMLSIGFGFVVENVMPPKPEGHDHLVEKTLRVLYSLLCAFSLVFPFWCLILALRMRYEVDAVVKDHVGEIHHQLIHVLRRGNISVQGALERLGDEKDAEKLQAEARQARRAQRNMSRTKRAWLYVKKRAMPNPEDEVDPLHYNEVAMWARQGVLAQLSSYSYYYPIAQSLLWLSMASIVMCCCILHSLHLAEIYHEEPWLWMIYCVISASSAIASIIFIMWMFCSGVIQAAHEEPRVHHQHQDLEGHHGSEGGGASSQENYGSTREDVDSDSESEAPPSARGSRNV